MDLPDHLYTAQDMADYAREAVAASKGLLTELSGDSGQLPEPPESLWLSEDGKITWRLGYMAGRKAEQLPQAELSDEAIAVIARSVGLPETTMAEKLLMRAAIAADRALRAQTKDKL